MFSAGPTWCRRPLTSAEARHDKSMFDKLVTRHVDELQRFLIRHPESVDRVFPRFYKFLHNRLTRDPSFNHRWTSLYRQRLRWWNKPSKRKQKYQVERKTRPSEQPVTTAMAPTLPLGKGPDMILKEMTHPSGPVPSPLPANHLQPDTETTSTKTSDKQDGSLEPNPSLETPPLSKAFSSHSRTSLARVRSTLPRSALL